MEAPVVEQVDTAERQLDPRVVSLDRLRGWRTALVRSLLWGGLTWALIALDVVPDTMTAGLLVVLAVATLTFAIWSQYWPAVAYRHAFYRLDHDLLRIRRGVLWRTVIDVPRSRVQHTDVSQGPLERHYGLATLSVYTAGTVHARVVLPGLAHEDALAMREQLLPRGERDVV